MNISIEDITPPWLKAFDPLYYSMDDRHQHVNIIASGLDSNENKVIFRKILLSWKV